jgi:hypothetical protein
MLSERRVRVLVVDEAYHLLKYGDYGRTMDSVKSLADMTGTKIVLVGTYNLFDLLTDHGQVARRGEIVHFNRYDKDRKADRNEFRRIVARLQEAWPCEEVPPLANISDLLLEASLGCVGILKELMGRLLYLQLEADGKFDAKTMLARAAKSEAMIETIREEIKAGESKVKNAAYGESLFKGELLDAAVKALAR